MTFSALLAVETVKIATHGACQRCQWSKMPRQFYKLYLALYGSAFRALTCDLAGEISVDFGEALKERSSQPFRSTFSLYIDSL